MVTKIKTWPPERLLCGLLPTLLLAAMLLPLPGARAQTAAGTPITDSASASYVDPNNSGQTVNAPSNSVTVTVAEVAGMTLTGSAVTDHTGGANILPGHVLYYDYVITNVGNDTDQFVIPGTVAITGPAALTSVQYSTNGGTSYTTVSGASATTPTVAEGGTVQVRVSATVTPSAAPGAAIAVLLGNTSPNDNSAGTQNQAYPAAPTGGAGKCYTSDPGSPVNGNREASATESTTAGSQPQAFAAVLLTHGALTQGVDSQHDTLAYSLGLNVNSSAWTNALPEYVPADLTATSISLDGSTVSRILISVAVPTGAVLTGTPAAPSGWTAIYTTSATTTLPSAAAWVSTAPSPLSNTTRIGFVAAGPITKGTSLTGFAFTVLTSGVSLTAPTTVAALAQLLGNSAGDVTGALCYDESGDANPANFNDDGSYGSNTPRSGVANPAGDGTDASNNNTGSGAGGQDNVYTVQPAGALAIGPSGSPQAVGPTDANDDYTNLSSPVPSGLTAGNAINPAAVSFTNTIKNTGSTTITNTIYVVPLPPSVLPGGQAADLPSGTTVTLTYGGNAPLYTYNGTAWTKTSGTAISATNIAAGGTVNITASMQLPNATALSTDTGKGYPVVLQAFIDSNGSGTYDSGEGTENTVDRVYTGFLKLAVLGRILGTDGTSVIQAYTQTLTPANLLPGRFLEYQVTYQNISSSGGTNCKQLNASNVVLVRSGIGGGANWALDNDGNGIIDTSNVVGRAVDSGGVVTFFSGNPATTSCSDQTGTTAATDVTKYLDTITGAIAPGASGTFTIRRKLN